MRNCLRGTMRRGIQVLAERQHTDSAHPRASEDAQRCTGIQVFRENDVRIDSYPADDHACGGHTQHIPHGCRWTYSIPESQRKGILQESGGIRGMRVVPQAEDSRNQQSGHRWDDGIWLGIHDNSGETYVGTQSGVTKVRTFRRKGIEADRWNAEKLRGTKGSPWEPVPGREGAEVTSCVALPRVPTEVPPMISVPKEESERRRPRIEKAGRFSVWPDPRMRRVPGCQPRARGEESHRGLQGKNGGKT